MLIDNDNNNLYEIAKWAIIKKLENVLYSFFEKTGFNPNLVPTPEDVPLIYIAAKDRETNIPLILLRWGANPYTIYKNTGYSAIFVALLDQNYNFIEATIKECKIGFNKKSIPHLKFLDSLSKENKEKTMRYLKSVDYFNR